MSTVRKGRVELRNIKLVAGEVNQPIPSDIPRTTQVVAGGKAPELILEVKPVYTPEAMKADAQGVTCLEAVVSPDGSVGPVRVTRSLHPDLDISAVAALKAWKFRPATMNSNPVPTVVEVEMSFIR